MKRACHFLFINLLVYLILPGSAMAQIVVGPGPGGAPELQLVEPGGTRTISVFDPAFFGGVSVALGDVDGDGRVDIIAGAGPLGGPHVKVFSGADLSELASFYAYDPTFLGGVSVAAGDVNGDGHADIITGAGLGGGPHVRVFSGADLSDLFSFYAYDPSFSGGVVVAAGDVNGDGLADIITGAGPGGGPHVRAFSGADLSDLASFYAYDPIFGGGVSVASLDVNGDGVADIVTGAGPGGGPHVRAFSGADLSDLASFYAYDPLFAGGVSVGAADFDGDGEPELVTGPGPGGDPLIRIFRTSDFADLGSFYAFPPPFTGGVFIGSLPGGGTGLRFTNASATSFTVGSAGTFAITTAGGSGVVTLTATGSLPSGVTFTDNGDGTATLAGTPAAGTAGAHVLTLTADNGGGTPATQTFTLNVHQAPAITSAAATTFPIGAPGTFAVTTSGFPLPSIARSGATLPDGITWVDNGDGTGTLGGTPAPGTAGTYAISFTATNAAGSSAAQAFTLTINDAPGFTSATSTAFTVGSLGTFTVTTVGTPTASITASALPAGVQFLDNGNGTGTLSGTPDAGTAGAHAITFTATNTSGTTTQSFALNVQQAPAITSAASTTFSIGAAGSFTVTTSGFPAATLAIGGAALPSGVQFVDNGDGTGTLSGTPATGTGGTYVLTFTATNAAGVSAPQTFTLTVSLGPTITSASAATFTVGSAGTFTITTTGFPLPAITALGARPAGVGFADNGNGTATLSGTPDPGTTGVYTLTVTAANGVLPNATQTFTLTVNQGPAITSAASATFTTGVAGSFTVTTSGVPAPAIAIGGVPLPANLLFVDNLNGTGTLSGTAAAGTEGTYGLTFTATNSVGSSAPQAFTLNVINLVPPTLDPIADPAAILESAGLQTVNLTGITAGGSETQPLQVTATSDTPGLIPAPTVSYTSPNATGSLTYTPVANAFGTAIVTVTVTDGGLDNSLATPGDNGTFSRQFTVTVTGVNDPPTLNAIPDPAPIAEDAGLQTVNLTGITAGTGESTQLLQVTASSNNTGLIPNPTVTYTSPAATGSLSYTPLADVSGSAIVTVTVTDGGLDNNLGTPGDNGTLSRTFTVVVSGDNDPPTLDAIPDPAAILEDAGAQSVTLSGITAGGGETQVLTVTALSSNVALIPNPTVTYTSPNATGSLAFTPVANGFGTAIITVRVTDAGTAFVERSFTVTVTAVNDAPSFTAGASQTVLEDAGPQTVAPWATAISPGPGEGSQTLLFVITDNTNPALFATAPAVAANGTLTYTPAAGASGIASLTLRLTDDGGTANGGVNQSATQVFTITVTAVNDAPTLDAIANPTAILEDAGLQTVNLAGISAGPGESAQPLQVTASSNNTGLIPNPTVTYTSPNATGSLSYTPVANASGSAVITVTVTDGGLDNTLATPGDNGTAVRTFTVTVTAVNDAPSFTIGANQTVLEDAGPQTVTPFATGISPGPGESDAVTFVITNNSNPGLFATAPAISVTGTLTYTSAANQHGVATLTVQLTDNGGTANGGVNQSATQQFTITVTPVNDAPVATAKALTAQANLLIGYTINLAANGSGDVTDVDNADAGFTTQAFTLTSVAALSCTGCVATITSGALGTFTFEPPPGQTGTFTLTYRVTDNGNPLPGVQSVPGAATGQPGVITITVSGPVVWFVDSTAPAGGNGTWTGTNSKAFQTLAQADAANVVLNDRVFVLNNSLSPITYADANGFTMPAGERLIGQGVTGASFDTVVLGVIPPAGSAARPAINGVRPVVSNTVTLADGATVTGINFAPSGAFAAMSGSGLATASAITIDQVTVAGGTSALSLTNVTNSVTVTNATFTNTSGAEVLINGGAGNVSIAAPISSNAGRSIDIQNRTGGTVSFTGAITDTGQGIFLNANPGSTINFTGGLSLSTTTNPGFTATGGGTVSATQNNTTIVNTITTTTGTALNVASTTIGASGMTFRSISANGAARGIVLNTTGAAGGLTVTGNGGSCTPAAPTCSGGRIQNGTGGDDSSATPVGTGIVLNGTRNVSLSLMRLDNHSNYAIRGTSVDGFTLASSLVDGANGTNVNTPFNDGSLVFFGVTGTSSGMTGTSSITNSTIQGGHQRNIAIDNSIGTLTLTVSGNTIRRTSDAAGDDGFFLEADTTANVTLTVSNNTFARHGGDHINVTMVNNAVVDVTVTGNTLHGNYTGTPEGNHPIGLGQGIFLFGAAFNGTVTYNVSNNGTVAVPFRGNRQGGAIHVNKGSGTATFSGRIENNVIGDAAVVGSGSAEAFGIIVGARGAGGSHTTLINNNQVRQYFDRGIVLEAGEGSAALNANVTNNTVSNFADATNSLHGIHFNAGILAADNNATCLHISGNSVATAGNEPAGGADIRVRRGSSTTVSIPGIGGSTSTDAQARLAALNPTATTISVTGTTFSNIASCPLP